jgi:hypothetical protein
MKIRNTASAGRGFGHDGNVYEFAAGEVKDVPDAIVAAARKDPANDGLITGGTLVVETAKAAPAAKVDPVPAVEPEAAATVAPKPPKSKEPK